MKADVTRMEALAREIQGMMSPDKPLDKLTGKKIIKKVGELQKLADDV